MDITNLSQWNVVDHFSCQKSINSIDWNPNPFNNPMIVVGGDDPVITIWEYFTQNKQWKLSCKLVGHTEPVTCVSWAPHLGRSYHTIASGSYDKTVRIWQLNIGNSEMNYKEVANEDLHNSVVWSVEWNITGTILASSGDDGKVRFWKLNFLNQWTCLSDINLDNPNLDKQKQKAQLQKLQKLQSLQSQSGNQGSLIHNQHVQKKKEFDEVESELSEENGEEEITYKTEKKNQKRIEEHYNIFSYAR